MYRSLSIRLTALIVILATTATTVAAQRGGFRGGGGVSIFRGAPAVRSAPGPAFIARHAPSLVGRPVTPFVQAIRAASDRRSRLRPNLDDPSRDRNSNCERFPIGSRRPERSPC